MNAYEFIKKGYGSKNLGPLKLYLSLGKGHHQLFRVTQLSADRIDLLNPNNVYKYLDKTDNLQVKRVSTDGKLTIKKVILHLE